MAIPDSGPMAVQTTSGVELQPVKSTAAAAEAPGGATEKLWGAKVPADARNSPHNPQHDPPQGLRGDFPSHSGNFTPPKSPAAGAGGAAAAAGGDGAAGGGREGRAGAEQQLAGGWAASG